MSRTKKPAKVAGAAAKRDGKGRSWFWLQGAVVGGVIAVTPGIALLLGVLLCPAIVYAAAAPEPGRPAGRTMLLMGLAAALAPLREQWSSGNTVGTALEILASPAVILLAWFACGAGWLMAETATVAIRLALRQSARRQAVRLRREQAELVEEWSLPAPRNPAGGAG